MTVEEAAPPPSGLAVLYYLRLAVNIARWDDVAIRRASRDPNAIYYGVLVWTLASAAPFALAVARLEIAGRTVTAHKVMLGSVVILLLSALLTLVQIGICHLLAKGIFHATGSFAAVLRPLLLGSVVFLLFVIPVPFVGLLAGSIAWIAVLMLVFEEVDGIQRMQAFLLSAGVGVFFRALEMILVSYR